MPPRFMRARRKAAPGIAAYIAPTAVARKGHNRPPPDPKPVAVSPTEHQFQVLVVDYLGWALSGIAHWWGTDAGAGKMGKAAAGRRKARGVRRGTPDLQVLYQGRIIGLELKRENKGRPSEDQLLEQANWRAHGAPFVFCETLEEVIAALVEFGVPVRISADRIGGRGRAR